MSEIITEQDQIIVKPIGNIVASMASDFRFELLGLIEDGATQLTVNLKGVRMVDSDGIGALIAAHKALAKNGGKLTIANPSDDIREFFSLMHLDKQFTIKKT
ncbi:MAG TPA: anti-sigma factor antagonist [Phycisphaerales bacterium]|nr:anti-sigma factor antagonist [Phycisphaerales bacterium]